MSSRYQPVPERLKRESPLHLATENLTTSRVEKNKNGAMRMAPFQFWQFCLDLFAGFAVVGVRAFGFGFSVI
ncbi:hypothetical protein ACFDAU_14990 [Sulfuriferula sp. GW1]|uniref:hypothetical protein n=1 Tax=Sulfuriferula sp. GW1 TaxID=3345111 RepID=UPI0039B08944